jgi:hypothetical protein
MAKLLHVSAFFGHLSGRYSIKKNTTLADAQHTKPVYTYKTTKANAVLLFVEYLPEDGRKRPKHVGDLLYDCILLYLTVVQLLE